MDINISEAEWEVMRVVWSNDEVTSKLVITLLGEKKAWSASTIKTLLARLVEKNILVTTKRGNKFIYTAAYSENDCLKNLTHNFLHKFCAKKTPTIANYLVEENNLSKSEIDLLIEKLKKQREVAPEAVPCDCIKGQCTCGGHH